MEKNLTLVDFTNYAVFNDELLILVILLNRLETSLEYTYNYLGASDVLEQGVFNLSTLLGTLPSSRSFLKEPQCLGS